MTENIWRVTPKAAAPAAKHQGRIAALLGRIFQAPTAPAGRVHSMAVSA